MLIDQKECRGYRKCVEACPYKKSLYRGTTRTSEKCIGCYPRVEGKDPETDGSPMETRCMAACIGQVRMQGLVKVDQENAWVEDRQNPLYYMVHVAKVALPLYPQLGTEPNGYYIPPRWVPLPYLKQMFGPGAEAAVERYRMPDRELLAVLQLYRRSNQMISRYEIEDGPNVYEAERNGKKVRDVRRHGHRLQPSRERGFPNYGRGACVHSTGEARELDLVSFVERLASFAPPLPRRD